jgi:hypothetical protein
MSKNFRFFLKKNVNNFRIFSHIQEKENFLFYFFMLCLAKIHFFCDKTTKNKIKGFLSNTPLLNLKFYNFTFMRLKAN